MAWPGLYFRRFMEGEDEDDFGGDIVRDYIEGRASVEGFLQVCRSYRGRAPHFLLSKAGGNDEVIHRCLRSVSEEKLCVLLEAILAEWSQLLTYPDDHIRDIDGGLLHRALMRTTSRRVHLLLAVPGCTRLLNEDMQTPLHIACQYGRGHPDVMHRLIDLDPDVLAMRDRDSKVPIHHALLQNDSGTHLLSPHVQRMVDLHPETLLFRDRTGLTPVSRTIRHRARHENVAWLRRLVEQHPRSVAYPDYAPFPGFTSLMGACNEHLELIKAVLDADPASLVIPTDDSGWRPDLPFEMAAWTSRQGEILFREQMELVCEETVRMALAVAEYVLGASALVGNGPAWFQMHMRDTLNVAVPDLQVELGTSGLSVAKTIRARSAANHDNDSLLVDLIRSWFCHDRARELLRGKRRLLRKSVLGKIVMDLYRLNRLGRYRPMVNNVPPSPTNGGSNNVAGDDSDSPAGAALHQVELLSSIATLDATYLQFREVSHHALLVHDGGWRLRPGRPR